MAGLPSPALAHEAAGRYIDIKGQRIFVREEGTGSPVLLLHGVPASSFLYRKMIPLLAKRGLRGASFDLPGLGFSDKPAGAAYDWHTLAGWIDEVVNALNLAPVHLVVHDICGPIGFEWAIKHPEKVKSVTIMNTILDVAVFSPPFPMWLYRVPVVRQIMMYTQNAVLFAPIMRRIGVQHKDRISFSEISTYLALLAHNHGRQPFLDIMAGFDLTREFGNYLREGMQKLNVPMQMIWGEHEIAIPRHQCDYIQKHLPLKHVHWVDARHFLQEDQAEACVKHTADFCLEVDAA